MPITSSTYTSDAHSQGGGAKWTIERHTDSTGRVHTVGPYLWDGVANRDTLLAARAAQLDVQLAEAEADALLVGA
jgi:hypothetical protein